MEATTSDATKITTVKQKDPKRVEMGKKLSALSKAAREKKKQLATVEASSWSIDYGYLIGIVGLTIVAASLYYSRLEYKNVAGESRPPKVEVAGVFEKKTGDFIEL